MNDELNNQAPSGMQQEEPQDGSLDNSDLIPQVQRLAGQGHLKQLLASGLIPEPEGSHGETAAALLAYPNFSTKESSVLGLKAAESQKLAGKLGKFLENIGSLPPISDKKGADKLLAKTHILLLKAPGYSRLKADDKSRVAHRILNLASDGNLDNLHEIIEHEANHSKAKAGIDSKIADLLEGKGRKEESVGDDERDRVKQYVEDNSLNDQLKTDQSYAEGGEVAPSKPIIKSGVATAYPEQAMMLGGAKARVHNYLNSVKPQKHLGLPFDSIPPQKENDRHYNNAVDTAARPLHILDQIKDGSIEPSKFKHFAQMHPELHELLKKKMTNKITEMQTNKGKKPPFKIRQAMSVFMTQPLEQSLTPQAIIAAQATFQPQQPQQGPVKGSGKSTKELGKSNNENLTPLQADAKRKTEK
jgi:hypothetical protein